MSVALSISADLFVCMNSLAYLPRITTVGVNRKGRHRYGYEYCKCKDKYTGNSDYEHDFGCKHIMIV